MTVDSLFLSVNDDTRRIDKHSNIIYFYSTVLLVLPYICLYSIYILGHALGFEALPRDLQASAFPGRTLQRHRLMASSSVLHFFSISVL